MPICLYIVYGCFVIPAGYPRKLSVTVRVVLKGLRSQLKEGLTNWYSGECFTTASKKKKMHVCAFTVYYKSNKNV